MGNGFWKPSDGKKRPSVSGVNRMVEVIPVTIAYAIAQVCFHLITLMNHSPLNSV